MGSNNLNIDFYRVKFNSLQQEEDESGNLTNGTDPTLEMLAKNMAWMHTNRFDLCLDDASLYHYGTNAVNDVNLAHAFISNKAKFHKSCKNRYIDSRIEKLKQKLFNPEQPPAKASKRERHSSAHDNTEERIRTAALYSVTDYILNQEKVSPELYLVTELENMYNESVRAALRDPLATSSGLISNHVTKFAEMVEEAVPELTTLKVGKKLYLVFHNRLSVGLTDSFEGDEFEVLRSKVVKLIRADLDNYKNSFEGTFTSSIIDSGKPSHRLRALMSEIIDGDPESISKEADMLAEIAQFNYRTIKGFRKVGKS